MKHILPLLIISSLTGCSASNDTEQVHQAAPATVANSSEPSNFSFESTLVSKKEVADPFEGEVLERNINFYMRALMQDLVSNLQYVNNSTPVAVTTFPFLDSDLQHSGLLGNQIAESLIHEIHKVGIPVLDFKVTDSLQTTLEGDFISSRYYEELNGDIPIRYIVAGNLVMHQGGVLVNARIVGISSKAVVASAQSFIPAHVANALLSSRTAEETEDQISEESVPLTKG